MTIRRISQKHDPEQIRQDLERYVSLALDAGASNAAIVPTGQIVVDERVLMKCRFPLCGEYGQCMNCPPHTGSIEEMRRRIGLFEQAIVLKLDVPSERVAGAAARGEGVEDLKKLCKIISSVESAAYYDGYYFATGFSSASCHFIWCRGLDCQALAGKGCRHRARAYTSMEAAGIDVFRLAASLDWEIYPVGMSATADMFPHGSRYGMVLIQ
jgi:predicted metal-binding protein